MVTPHQEALQEASVAPLPEPLGARLKEVLAPLLNEGGTLTVQTLPQEASPRRYHRVTVGGERGSVVVMEIPPPAYLSLPPPTTFGRAAPFPLPASQELPFLNVHRFLVSRGMPVPEILATALQSDGSGFIVLEDLGGVTLENLVDGAVADVQEAAYGAAIDLLGRFQRVGEGGEPNCLAFSRRFDVNLLRWELDHFIDWFLGVESGVTLDAAEQATVDSAFSAIAAELAALPPVLVHRDFQSRNLMVRPHSRDLVLIDFQDALMGPPIYDLVALLRDSYVELSNEIVLPLLARFAATTGTSLASIKRLFHLQTIQRKLKDSGRFIFLEKVRALPHYRASLPPSLRYVRQAFAALPELAELARVLERYVPALRS